jgi:hypothetical protein
VNVNICEWGGGYLRMWWRLSVNVVETICGCGGGYLQNYAGVACDLMGFHYATLF